MISFIKMRTLKFRIWDETDKKYWYSGETEAFLIKLNGIVVDGQGCKYDEHYIPEQYTELNDIDNEEIYEGDILKVHNTDDIYKVEYSWYKAAFVLIDKYSSVTPLAYLDNLEIIGNIHQNLGLLK